MRVFGIFYIDVYNWAEKCFYYLNKEGITNHDKRFDEPITRGEAMALLAKMKGYK